MKNQLPVLKEFDYDRVGSFTRGNPYVIAFCYTGLDYYHVDKFVVKGGLINVDAYLENLNIPMLVWKTFWRHGRHRGGSSGPYFVNFKRWTRTKQRPWVIPENRQINKKVPNPRYFYRNYAVRFLGRIWLRFRRFPRKWLPEYDEMIRADYPELT